MKIDAFYFNDLSDYDDILEYLCSSIESKYYGVGKNSISISQFINFLKQVIKIYIKLKYNKNLTVVLTLQRIEEKLVSNISDKPNQIRIRLSNDKIGDILNGTYPNFEDYIQELLDQLETEITSQNGFNFNEYLNIQVNGLVNIAMTELKASFSTEYLRENIIKKESWIKLAEKSSVFNDYYTAYMENSNNKKMFYNFLKLLVNML